MKKNIDYWEEDFIEREEVNLSALELSELIEQRVSSGCNTTSSKVEVNKLIDEYNRKFGKTYSKV